MSGVLSTMAIKNAEDSIRLGNIEQGKQELLGIIDILDESCLGSDVCTKIKNSVHGTVKLLESNDLDKAKEQLGTIVTLSFNNKEQEKKVEPDTSESKTRSS